MTTAMRYRDLSSLDDFRRVVELEKLVWEYADAEDVVPVPILAVNAKRGGILVGAFDDAGEMMGFVYSLPGLRRRILVQWSHMLGVVERHRNTGVGFQLKLEQRLRALQMGIDLIEWTFDPLQAMNAHLNFEKLGVVAAEYEENIYGESSSPLHSGTPTDRLVAEWWLRTGRVEQRIAGHVRVPPASPATMSGPTVNHTRRSGQWLACEGVNLTRTEPSLRVEIPMGFGEMQAQAPDVARDWRMTVREIFTTYFRNGYHASEFILDRPGGRGWYVLTRAAGASE